MLSSPNWGKWATCLWFWFNISAVLWSAILLYTIYFHTTFWYLLPIYFVWFYFDKNTPSTGARPANKVKSNFIYKHACNYFPIRMVANNDNLNPKKNYLGISYPHGVFPVGISAVLFTNYGNYKQCFPDHQPRCATLNLMFYIPFYREYLLLHGIISSSKASIVNSLKAGGGNFTVVCVGGAEEGFLSEPGRYRILLKNRKGFVKIALATGTDLVPIFTFGETEVFTQVKLEGALHQVQEWIKKVFGFASVVMSSLIPKQVPLTVVVGKPILVEKDANPSKEKVDQLHNIFITELIKLFEDNKQFYVKNYENIFLEIL